MEVCVKRVKIQARDLEKIFAIHIHTKGQVSKTCKLKAQQREKKKKQKQPIYLESKQRHEHPLHQRRNRNGKSACKKMFNIISYQG